MIRIYEREERSHLQSDLLFFGSIVAIESITILLISLICLLFPNLNSCYSLKPARLTALYSPLLYGTLLWLPKRMPKILKFLFFVVLSVVGIVFISGATFLTHERIQTKKVARRIAEEFQIETNFDSVIDHMSQEVFKPGMTREEVHDVLDKIGNWETQYFDDPKINQSVWHSDTQQEVFQEEIRFTDHYTHNVMSSWIFFFDADGLLVDERLLSSD